MEYAVDIDDSYIPSVCVPFWLRHSLVGTLRDAGELRGPCVSGMRLQDSFSWDMDWSLGSEPATSGSSGAVRLHSGPALGAASPFTVSETGANDRQAS